ncbi:hypothetical protein [Streptomyces sp. NBC_00454]|uniref:hypothetical protein n=1 Tax=Streptomyces sp. NBC_00454 TaxID=2975747 RepID=UPI00324DB7C3
MTSPRLSAPLGGAAPTLRDGDTCPSDVDRVPLSFDACALSHPGRTWSTWNFPPGRP